MIFLRAALPYLLAIATAFLVAFGFYSFGVHVEHQRRVAEVNGLNAQHAQAITNATQRALDAEQRERDKEAKHATDMAALDAQHTKEMNDAKTVADRTIADLRAGTVRVRDRFTCTAGNAKPAGSTSQAGTSTSVGDAAQAGGLQTADAEFLLREAERADEVTVQLGACQAIVRGDRK